MNQPFWSAAMRKCSLPAAPAFGYFAEVLARFSENNFFAGVQPTVDLRSSRSQFLSLQRELFLAVPKSVADSRGPHILPRASRGKVTGCLLSREASGVLVVWKLGHLYGGNPRGRFSRRQVKAERPSTPLRPLRHSVRNLTLVASQPKMEHSPVMHFFDLLRSP